MYFCILEKIEITSVAHLCGEFDHTLSPKIVLLKKKSIIDQEAERAIISLEVIIESEEH